jgi:hypothetical protein
VFAFCRINPQACARIAGAIIGAVAGAMMSGDDSDAGDSVSPFPPDRVKDPAHVGPTDPSIPIPGGVTQICRLKNETETACVYECPDGSWFFLEKGKDCSEKCNPTEPSTKNPAG